MPLDHYGPFPVQQTPVDTGVSVQPGDEIRTVSRGRINFGSGWFMPWGAPVLDADGDNWQTPGNFPAPGLRKNSLICRVGGVDFQGGVDSVVQIAGASGNLVLLPNDATPQDNTEGWSVRIEHQHPLRGVPTPQPALEIADIEVVQAIQKRGNQIRLVAGKRTMVRVFVDSGMTDGTDLGAGPNVVAGVQGELEIISGGTSLGTVDPLNGPDGAPGGSVQARPRGEFERDQYAHSLNFELPPAALTGTVMVRARVWAPGHRHDSDGGFLATRSTGFSYRNRPVQPLTPIMVDDPWQGLPAPSMAQFTDAVSRSTSRLPVGENGFRINPPVRWAAPAPLNLNPSWWALIAQLTTSALLTSTPVDGVRTAAVNRNVGSDYGGIALPRILLTVPALVASIGRGDIWEESNFAHELGHVFGVNHANAGCGEPVPWDANLPGRTDDVGMYVRRRMTVPRASSEIMSYCRNEPRWPSTFYFDRMFDAATI